MARFLKMKCLFIPEGILTTFLVINPLQYVGTSTDGLYATQFRKHFLHALIFQKAMRTTGDGERWHKDEYSTQNLSSETQKFTRKNTQRKSIIIL